MEFESKFTKMELGKICNIKIGGTPSRSNRDYFDKGTHLWVSISEMNGNIITDTKEKLTDTGVENSNVKLIKAGTTLLSFKLSIGKLAIAGKDLYTNEAIAGLEIANQNNVLDKYLFHLFDGHILNLEKDGQNAMGASLNSKFLKQLKIPVPPLAIQQKIIKEIEAIEQKGENAGKEMEKQRNKITELFASINAKGRPLKDVTSKIGSGATPRGGDASYKASGISLIRSQNIYDYGMLEKGLAFIDEEQADKLKNVIVEKNDVLFNITGASVARCCIVDEKYLPARVNQHVAIIRASKKVLPQYLHQMLISFSLKSQLLKIARGATSREAINKQQLEEFKIPLPSIEEQKKLVGKLDNLQDKIKTQEQTIAHIEEEKKAVLVKYLEG